MNKRWADTSGFLYHGSLFTQIVIVSSFHLGFTAVGLTDRMVTPLSPNRSAVEGVANVVENILQGTFLIRPSWAPALEIAVLFVLGLYASLALPRFRATLGALVTLLLLILATVIPMVLFQQGLWIRMVPGLLMLVLSYPAIVSRRFFITELEKEFVEEESDEANKMLGLAFQGKGMLDLAFEKLRREVEVVLPGKSFRRDPSPAHPR